jgi:hypothetical protein
LHWAPFISSYPFVIGIDTTIYPPPPLFCPPFSSNNGKPFSKWERFWFLPSELKYFDCESSLSAAERCYPSSEWLTHAKSCEYEFQVVHGSPCAKFSPYHVGFLKLIPAYQSSLSDKVLGELVCECSDH